MVLYSKLQWSEHYGIRKLCMLLCYLIILGLCLTEVDVHVGLILFTSCSHLSNLSVSVQSLLQTWESVLWNSCLAISVYKKILWVYLNTQVFTPWRFSRCFMNVTVLPALGTEQISMETSPASHQLTVIHPHSLIISLQWLDSLLGLYFFYM